MDEMSTPRPLDDASADALIAGRPTAAGDEGLLAFIEDMRVSSHGPVPSPSVALASVLDGGLVTEKGDLPATAASNVTGPARQAAGLPKWRRKRMIISTFLAGLSVPAKAFVGISMAAASVGGAAAAGVPVAQTAVEAVSPVEFHDNSDDAADHGENVSDTARDTEETGKDKGKAVSDEAKTKGEEMRQDGDRPTGAPETPGSTGLDKANTTPGADHVPDSVPATPAAGADNQPADTPAGPPADVPVTAPVSTPAGPPTSTPAGPPAGVPVDRP